MEIVIIILGMVCIIELAIIIYQKRLNDKVWHMLETSANYEPIDSIYQTIEEIHDLLQRSQSSITHDDLYDKLLDVEDCARTSYIF